MVSLVERVARLMVVVAGLCGCADNASKPADLPPFSGPEVRAGALLCVTGPNFSAKASTLEKAVILAQEHINGSTRAFDVQDPNEIPCRSNGTCGLWAGRDATGQALRGELRIVVADTEERVSRAVSAAEELVQRVSLKAIIGPCDSDVLHAVQQQVTRTESVLITPVVTADSVTAIADRTPDDLSAGLPGYVYRTVPPDYIQVEVLSHIATNAGTEKTLIRHEDVTDDICTAEASDYCSSKHGPNHQCLERVGSGTPERDYFDISGDSCAGKPADYCATLGKNSECFERDNGTRVCARYRTRKYCTEVVSPRTALVLYQEDDWGRGLRDALVDHWVDRKQRIILSAQGFDPANPADFSAVISTLFAGASLELDRSKREGDLPADYPLGDSVVFLFGKGREAALLLQEWRLQLNSLADGAERVFWLGTDVLRSRLLADQVDLNTIRNAYMTDPYDLSAASETFFSQLFRRRWGVEPDQYAGSAFDAALLIALANERAGYLRGRHSPEGTLGPNDSAVLKDSIEAVSQGCIKKNVGDACLNPVVGTRAESFAEAMAAVAEGREVKIRGVTGDLSLSPAGDRLSVVRLWRVDPEGPSRGFFRTSTRFLPEDLGVVLRE